MPASLCNRSQRLAVANDAIYDVVVVGGGITGTGIARDAAMRGLKTLLLEAHDIGSGTSSRSSRLVHGGLRYLEHYRVGLVHESVAERWLLMKLAPHLVHPLPFVFPVYRGEKPGLVLVSTGTFVYSLLSAFRTPGPRSRLTARQAVSMEPDLKSGNLVGAARYFDCSTHDARLTLETALSAVHAGALVVPQARFTGAHSGKELVDVTFVDNTTGQAFAVGARTLAIAVGPWTDSALPAAVPGATRWLRTTKGVHLVFKAQRFPLKNAVVMRSTHNDHRVTFAIPWGSCTYVGTTDTDFPDPLAQPTASRDDADYLLALCNHYFPQLALTVEDVVSVWSGVRPLIAPEDEVAHDEHIDPSDISREEKVDMVGDRILVVAGGKLTTYRRMARKVVDRLATTLERRHGMSVPRCTTHAHPLPGAAGWLTPRSVAPELEKAFPSLPVNWLADLARRYGTQAPAIAQFACDHPDLGTPLPGAPRWRLAEAAWAIDNEYVCTPEDFLMRRTHIHFKADDQGAQAAPVIAQLISERAGTSPQDSQRSLQAYLESISAWKNAISERVRT